jgi:prevent-host-death family protein
MPWKGEFAMSSVGIRDLKANLSAHLRTVQNGQEITVLDHKVPIAKIVPIDPIEEPESEEMELVAAGVLRMPKKPLPDDYWETAPAGLSPELLIQTISQERDEAEDRLLG